MAKTETIFLFFAIAAVVFLLGSGLAARGIFNDAIIEPAQAAPADTTETTSATTES